MKYIVEEYFNSLTITDAKVNERCIEDILASIKILCNRLGYEKEEVCRWVEKSRFKLWTYLIKCDVL